MTAPVVTPSLLSLPLPGRGEHRATRLVVHSMGEFILNGRPEDGPVGATAAHDWLQALGLSAHALISPGGTVIECVPRTQIAYHAKGHNTGLLGVELLVPGTHTYDSLALAVGWNVRGWAPVAPLPVDPYTIPQYRALSWWLVREAHALGLTWDAVTSHDRLDHTRKFDPGPVFDWPLLEAMFAERLALEEGYA